MTATHIATSVWDDNANAWDRRDIEPIQSDVERDLSQAEVSADDIGGHPDQRLLVELLDEDGETIESTEITATGDTGATTYAAHIITSAAADLGAPEVCVMTEEDENGAADVIATYPLDIDGDERAAIDVVEEHGWRVTTKASTEVEVGYTIVTVEARRQATATHRIITSVENVEVSEDLPGGFTVGLVIALPFERDDELTLDERALYVVKLPASEDETEWESAADAALVRSGLRRVGPWRTDPRVSAENISADLIEL